MVKEFVYRVGLIQGLTEDQAKRAGGKIFTFGSYRLGVHNAGKFFDSKMMKAISHFLVRRRY